MAQPSLAARLALATLLFLAAGCRPPIPLRSGAIPPPPLTFACSVNPSVVYPGNPITVTGSTLDFSPRDQATYTWTLDGVLFASLHGSDLQDGDPVADIPARTVGSAMKLGYLAGGQPKAATATIGPIAIPTRHLAPGEHTVQGQLRLRARPVAACTAHFTVKAFDPPTIKACASSPSVLDPGGQATITALAFSPQNRPLTYSYSSSAGFITGNSSHATLTAAGAFGTITATCNVIDDQGQTASTTTTVTIQVPSAPPPPKAIGPQCGATPASVPPGPGNVVHLTVAEGDLHPGEHLEWTFASAPGSLVDNTIDTGQLTPNRYIAIGTIAGGAFTSRSCTATFTVDRHARAADWQPISQFSKLLVHNPRRNDREAGDFVLYTYLLVRTMPTTDDDKLRLRNIVSKILAAGTAEGLVRSPAPPRPSPSRGGTHPIRPTPASPAPPAHTGAIYIPVNQEPDRIRVDMKLDHPPTVAEQATWIVDQEHYDLTTAKALLLRPGCVQRTGGCRDRLSGDGPFLVTTRIPLSAGYPPSILIQDFAGTSPAMADTWTGEFLRIAELHKNWAGYTLQRAAQDLTLALDREGQAITQVGDARKSFVAMWLPSRGRR